MPVILIPGLQELQVNRKTKRKIDFLIMFQEGAMTMKNTYRKDIFTTDTMNTTAIIIESIFNQLGISYRAFPVRWGKLYLCKLMNNNLTFNLQFHESGTIKVWRFIDTVPFPKEGAKFEYCKAEEPYVSIGYEVTDDGDISFYTQQKIDLKDNRREERMIKMIKDYSEIISRISLRKYLTWKC